MSSLSTSQADPTRNVLIIGEHNTGKTVFFIQSFGRLNDGRSRLRLVSQPENMTLITKGMDQLGDGRAPSHTPEGTHEDLRLDVEDASGQAFSIVWPDYAGEQVTRMALTRAADEAWESRVLSSSAWLLFVRLDHATVPRDTVSSMPGPPLHLASAPDADSEGSGGDAEDVPENTDQARMVETLQLLLHTRGLGISRPIDSVPLAVIVSCWDELNLPEGTRPDDTLTQKLPLLAAFVRANWSESSRVVFGLSAQGKRLDSTTPDREYRRKGPEAMGYVVSPDGSTDPDLTVILDAVFGRVQAVAAYP